MPRLQQIVSALLIVALPGTAWGATEQEERLERSIQVLREIMDAPDSSIPRDLLARSECVGIIPSVVKFAFIFGARHGAGYVVCRKESGKGPWGAPAAFKISGGSFGLQLGVSATDFVLLFMNHAGVEKLLEDKFTLGADASVAGGPVGRTASAATDVQLTAQILSYARSKGLFAGLALEGAVLRPSNEDNERLYGSKVTARQILIDATVPMPSGAETLARLLGGQPEPPAVPMPPPEIPQEHSGTIVGSVRDATGAMIPDAIVTITNVQTGASRWLATNPEGRYTAEGLPPGTYEIKAEATGMSPVVADPLSVAAGSQETIDFTLGAPQ
jgi:lipid-binding SYLF domain-containing protein